MTATLKTLQVGNLSINGTLSPDGSVASFLGIPFARIPARWRQAVLIDAFDSGNTGVLDATKYGPAVPQPPNATLLNFPDIRQSEFECLNLNVWVPTEALESTKTIPVIAWVHGGGFIRGHNAVQDGGHLVRRSVQLGRPVVIVAMNYRMHFFGFVGCKELSDEARALGESGYYNTGLHDQRLGFQWIQRHIHLFGGSATRVTAMGESAGAQSLFWHIKSAYPAFQRAIMHSSPFHEPLTKADHQAQWDALFVKLGVPLDASGAIKLAAARNLSAQEVIAAFDMDRPAFPCIDDGFLIGYDPATIGDGIYWGSWPSWLDAVVIGVMKEEAPYFLPKHTTASPATMRAELIASAGSSLPAQTFFTEVADAYGVKGEEIDQPAAFYALQKFVGDGFFVCHAVDAAREAARQSKSVYFEAFDERDEEQPSMPWLEPGRWAYHAFDVPFLFYAPKTQARPNYKRIADDMSQAYAAFAYGAEPWEALGASGKCGVFSGQGLRMEALNERVREGDRLRTDPERKDLFRKGASQLQLGFFEVIRGALRKL